MTARRSLAQPATSPSGGSNDQSCSARPRPARSRMRGPSRSTATSRRVLGVISNPTLAFLWIKIVEGVTTIEARRSSHRVPRRPGASVKRKTMSAARRRTPSCVTRVSRLAGSFAVDSAPQPTIARHRSSPRSIRMARETSCARSWSPAPATPGRQSHTGLPRSTGSGTRTESLSGRARAKACP
jgi:hypothetical protein